MRDHIREEIDKGKSDRQIFEDLRKEYGPDLTRPHLQP
jgi:cytochrome c-type biogenesis protein CcmH/NrfF